VETVWDICCDHGHIGKSLINRIHQHKTSELKEVIFLDVVPGIMNKINESFKDTDIPIKISILTSDARTQNYKNNSINCFIVAGIGGDLCIEIVNQIFNFLSDHDYVIISVHKNTVKTRQHLKKMELRLYKEILVKENSKYYEMLLIGKRGDSEICEIGEELWEKFEQDHSDYLTEQISFYEKKAEYRTEFKNILQKYKKIKHKNLKS